MAAPRMLQRDNEHMLSPEQKVIGLLELLGSGVYNEGVDAVAGIGGLLAMGEPGIGGRMVKAIQNKLGYETQTEGAKHYEDLMAKHLGPMMQEVEEYKQVLPSKFDSPAMKAMAYAFPDALMYGVPGAGLVRKRLKGMGDDLAGVPSRFGQSGAIDPNLTYYQGKKPGSRAREHVSWFTPDENYAGHYGDVTPYKALAQDDKGFNFGFRNSLVEVKKSEMVERMKTRLFDAMDNEMVTEAQGKQVFDKLRKIEKADTGEYKPAWQWWQEDTELTDIIKDMGYSHIETLEGTANNVPAIGVFNPKNKLTPSTEPEATDFDYRMEHTAPVREAGASLDDVSNVYPDDIYSAQGLQYYGAGLAGDADALGVMRKARGNPDAEVNIYRAAPKGTKINKGDWVSLSKDYARSHGDAYLDDYEILETKAKARDLFTTGDALTEWGWNPE